jgi:hypothetical protein
MLVHSVGMKSPRRSSIATAWRALAIIGLIFVSWNW